MSEVSNPRIASSAGISLLRIRDWDQLGKKKNETKGNEGKGRGSSSELGPVFSVPLHYHKNRNIKD